VDKSAAGELGDPSDPEVPGRAEQLSGELRGYHQDRAGLQPIPSRHDRVVRSTRRQVAALTAALAVVTTLAAGCAPPGGWTSPYRYVLPVAPGVAVSYGATGSHHDYPAADLFAATGCGTPLVSPVDGSVLETRTVDLYDRATDNPAYRGGRYVSILGVDGVRYYLAHLASVAGDVVPGTTVRAGQQVGLLGRSGDAGACHVHFGVSPPCPGKEWGVRRGVVWPQPYLDAWRHGQTASPSSEVTAWTAQWPGACALAMAAPHAGEA
jgi:murein DD-endopeptidase MepM/ murein hydrolase activator NlpD